MTFGDKGVPGVEVGAIGGRLVWSIEHLDLVRPNKAPLALPTLTVGKESTVTPVAATPSPNGELVLVVFDMDPGAKYSQGFNAFVETRL